MHQYQNSTSGVHYQLLLPHNISADLPENIKADRGARLDVRDDRAAAYKIAIRGAVSSSREVKVVPPTVIITMIG